MMKYLRRLLYGPGVNPLPLRTLTLLFLIQLFMGMTSTMCFSYLPKLVKTFGVSEVNAGEYAGYIASSVYVGWILCGYASGYMADAKGHKLILMISVAGMIVFILLFGISSSYYWALASRFGQGLCLGSVGICKSILTLACDDTNITLAFSIFFSCWTFAFIVGPTMAGFLVFPAQQYPDVFSEDGIFGRYGVLLPNLILSICLTVTLTLSVLFLPRDKRIREEGTDEERKNLLSGEPIKPKDIVIKENNVCPVIREHNNNRINDSNSNKKVTVSIIDTKGNQKDSPVSGTLAPSYPSVDSSTIKESRLKKSFRLFNRKPFMVSVLLYCLTSFSVIGVEDMFPVFAATTDTFKGLELSTSEIGTILLGSSVLLFLVQLFVISKISQRYGTRRTYIGGAVLLGLTSPLIPTIYLIQKGTQRTAYAIFIMSMNQVLINSLFVNVNVLLNNSVTADVYGVANGIAMTAGSFGRAISPSVFGNIYSWSLRNIKSYEDNKSPLGFPFNQYFSFLLTGLVFLLCGGIATFFLAPTSPSSPTTVKKREET